jgi:hypothetical protein
MSDENNGGNGENGLQEMLKRTIGREIILLPALPKNSNAKFKLHAPYDRRPASPVSAQPVTGNLGDPVATDPLLMSGQS